MGYEVNKKLREMQGYTVEKYDDSVIRMDANESPYDLPVRVKAKIAAAIARTDFNRYPDPMAEETCKAFADLHNIPIECIAAGNGSDELISVIMASFTKKWDRVLSLLPDFSMYRFYGSIGEIKPILIDKDENLDFNADDVIEKANEENAKLIIFSNPCNPTGRGMMYDDVEKIISSVEALVVVDEAYMDFWDQSVLSLINKYDNLIVLKTMSKAIGLASIRLGFAVANENLTGYIKKAKSPYNVNTVTQKIGAIVLNEWAVICERIEKIINGRDCLYANFTERAEKCGYRIQKTYTNFVLLEFNNAENARFVFETLKKNGIAVRHMDNKLRITAGTNYQNEKLLEEFDSIFTEAGVGNV